MSKIAKRTMKRSIKVEPCDTEPISETVCETSGSAVAVAPTGSNVSFWLGRRLVLSCFNGQILIHVREYQSTDGKEYPTKKGACFTPGRLMALHEKIESIDEVLRQQEVNASYNVTIGPTLYKAHLGAGIYVSVSERYPGVSLRRYWLPEGQEEPIPTRNGIYLPANQWAALKIKLNELLTAFPGLAGAIVCSNSHGGNQMEFFGCRECAPFSQNVRYGERFGQ